MPVILIVESDSDLSTVVQSCDENADWQIEVVKNRSDAEHALENVCPEVIVTDVWPAPDEDDESLDEIRREFPHVPLVIVLEDEQATVRALRLGASSYVARSRTSRDLITTIQRVLELTRSEDRDILSPHLRICEQQFQLPNDPHVIATAVRHMRRLGEAVGVCSRSDSHRLSVALDEALMNAMVHGNLEVSSELREQGEQRYHAAIQKRMQTAPYGDRHVFLSAKITPDLATFVIRDEGPGFDRANIPDPTEPENLEKPHGRGLMLMEAFMDVVRYNERGNKITLLKRLASRRPAAVATNT